MFNSVDEAIAFAKNDDDGGIPLFRHDSVLIPHSEPPDYENVVMVTIMNRGDSKTVIERPKRPEDEKRWPQHWAAFLAGEEVPLNGTPLTEFPAMTPADIARCKGLHIKTVEELAEYPDGQIKSLGGRGYALKKAAAEFVEYRKTDVSGLLERIAELEKQVGDSTKNGSGRSGGNGVSEAVNAGGKQQSGSKKRASPRKSSGKKARKRTPVDSPDEGA